MPFFSRNPSVPIFYLDQGPKENPPATVLLVPGLSCDMHDWSWQVPFLLAHNLRVISIDPRGQGRSAAPPPTSPHRQPPGSWPGPDGSADPAVVDYYPQSTALDAIALLAHLNVTKDLVVMSHSLGDAAGYFIATALPGTVVACVGLDPIHAYPRSPHDSMFFDSPKNIVPMLVDHFDKTMYSPACPAWQRTWHLRRMQQLDDEVAFGLCWGGWGDADDSPGRREASVAANAGRLKCPRLTVGSVDWYVETDRTHMPKGDEALDEIVLMEGWGHWFHQLKSEEFNATLGAWLEKIGVLQKVKKSAA
ncbi:hypothetical protein CGCF415_v014627 [Colletotrichum fructicola]|uniref:AB hydrolase-1 domain-containing protein n=1 Tax=Colletotrichum fructicola (strain Nara gc5) TaxID=1213859 RepID=A0A7J6JPC1_COLFN|nr:uncharacterized protein CGMCC3_g13536 [Colletotrichum fructicola]KAF4492389.1 hypothetical protein CGGC5_v000114 [Colletotrichum fructicola Nara gc5]KAI8286278.1 hypothetical protein K4K60_000591 [Colletotrichum sp. SAR11_57]KAE9570375.1 hypothetical protein CGMCC3_g13536 [Colletotrichum fructicola]KAF4413742.1 Non-heme chloroperoxidase [Colletotrichum fructicola]KAF4888051.1 hypothetical protein CGCF415_v014627 [Colletotrichum fructicola]